MLTTSVAVAKVIVVEDGLKNRGHPPSIIFRSCLKGPHVSAVSWHCIAALEAV